MDRAAFINAYAQKYGNTKHYRVTTGRELVYQDGLTLERLIHAGDKVESHPLEVTVSWYDPVVSFIGSNWQWLWIALLVVGWLWGRYFRRRNSNIPHTPPSPTPSKLLRLEGLWESPVWGLIDIKQVGEDRGIIASYAYSDQHGYWYGHLAGEIAGNRVNFRWWESLTTGVSYDEASPGRRGDGYFLLSEDGSRLGGKWRRSNMTDWAGDWHLIKTEPNPRRGFAMPSSVDGKWIPLLVALVGAAATILVGYWHYYQKPEKKEFVGRVIEAKTEKRIRHAKVSLEVQGAPSIIYTDSEGIFSFPLKETDRQIRVRVEAEGYEEFGRLITPSSKVGPEEIQLSLAQSAPPFGHASNARTQQIKYSGRVVDSKTNAAIPGAKISLHVGGAPPIVYTDSEGIYTFTVDFAGSGRVRIEAAGYQIYERHIELDPGNTNLEDIRLTPVLPPPPRSESSQTEQSLPQIASIDPKASKIRCSDQNAQDIKAADDNLIKESSRGSNWSPNSGKKL